jgi:hypothetical protein
VPNVFLEQSPTESIRAFHITTNSDLLRQAIQNMYGSCASKYLTNTNIAKCVKVIGSIDATLAVVGSQLSIKLKRKQRFMMMKHCKTTIVSSKPRLISIDQSLR